MKKYAVKRILLVIAGSLFLTLGAIGLFVPILPTVPFLLLTSFCYFRSSERLYGWLLSHRLFGKHIKNYTQNHAVTRGVKVGSLCTLWLSLGITMVLVNVFVMWVILPIIGLAVSTHIVLLKTA